jgi:alkylated DNA nucleotide flippase Atl1
MVLLDATATKQACDNPRHHSRAKHMETFLAWVRHVIQEGHIRTQNIYSPRRQRGRLHGEAL